MEAIHQQLGAGRGSRPGRPSNPRWTLRRLVPFSPETWQALQERAEAFSAAGRRVSPAQLAAVLLDRALLGEPAGGEPAGGGPAPDAAPEPAPELRQDNRDGPAGD